MNYSVTLVSNFKREAKRLIKKFPSLKQELQELNDSSIANPEQGEGIGRNCYKIRLSIASKGRGKRGGARVITHVYINGLEGFLLSIYDKSEQDNIPDSEIEELLKGLY